MIDWASMNRIALVPLCALAFGYAGAQIPGATPNVLKVRVEAGYGFSGDFTDFRGNNTHLEGPFIGAELPIYSMFDTDVAVGFQWFGGGRLFHGSDSDGDVYRLLGTVRHVFGKSGLYGKFGAGFSHCEPRAVEFHGDSGSVAMFAVGTPLTGGFLRQLSPNLELSYFASGSGQLRGLFIGLVGSL